jgi:hypothetical protein
MACWNDVSMERMLHDGGEVKLLCTLERLPPRARSNMPPPLHPQKATAAPIQTMWNGPQLSIQFLKQAVVLPPHPRRGLLHLASWPWSSLNRGGERRESWLPGSAEAC